jgi:hypothetical protein
MSATGFIHSPTVNGEQLVMSFTRYIFLWLVLLTFVAVPSGAGAASKKSAPRIAIDAPSFDFNDVKEGTAVDHAFRVVNTGDGVLKIRRIKTS